MGRKAARLVLCLFLIGECAFAPPEPPTWQDFYDAYYAVIPSPEHLITVLPTEPKSDYITKTMAELRMAGGDGVVVTHQYSFVGTRQQFDVVRSVWTPPPGATWQTLSDGRLRVVLESNVVVQITKPPRTNLYGADFAGQFARLSAQGVPVILSKPNLGLGGQVRVSFPYSAEAAAILDLGGRSLVGPGFIVRQHEGVHIRQFYLAPTEFLRSLPPLPPSLIPIIRAARSGRQLSRIELLWLVKGNEYVQALAEAEASGHSFRSLTSPGTWTRTLFSRTAPKELLMLYNEAMLVAYRNAQILNCEFALRAFGASGSFGRVARIAAGTTVVSVPFALAGLFFYKAEDIADYISHRDRSGTPGKSTNK